MSQTCAQTPNATHDALSVKQAWMFMPPYNTAFITAQFAFQIPFAKITMLLRSELELVFQKFEQIVLV